MSIDISEKTASNLLIGMAGMEIVARLPFIIFGNRLSVNRNIVIAVACVMGAFATYALAMWASLHIMIVYVIGKINFKISNNKKRERSINIIKGWVYFWCLLQTCSLLCDFHRV